MDVGRPRVEIVTRAGCHLCGPAREIVAAVCDELAVGWRETDVDSDQGLVEVYSDLVPVVLVDGVQQGFWRIDAGRLRRALA